MAKSSLKVNKVRLMQLAQGLGENSHRERIGKASCRARENIKCNRCSWRGDDFDKGSQNDEAPASVIAWEDLNGGKVYINQT